MTQPPTPDEPADDRGIGCMIVAFAGIAIIERALAAVGRFLANAGIGILPGRRR